MQFAVDLNLNALANAPTLAAGLLESMTLSRDKEPNLVQYSEAELQLYRNNIDNLKASTWQLILFLWLIQCIFMRARYITLLQ